MLKSVLFASPGPQPGSALGGFSAREQTIGRALRSTTTFAKCAALIQATALIGYSAIWFTPDAPLEMAGPTKGSADFVREANKIGDTRSARSEWAFGGYGGVAFTYPTTVTIKNGEQTNMTASDFDWIGRPFKGPIYYGLRAQRWGEGRLGGMIDFIHAKAIAKPDSKATFTGSHNGQPLPAEAPIGDIFSKLEFSHGHNMVTLNGLFRLVPSWFRFRPYIGAGGGVSLPHSEVGFRADNVRTYEYHYAGFVGQGLAGLEVQLGRASVFFEYKFTYAPYDIPLSHERIGDLLVTDLWRQFQAWRSGEPPPGGRLTTTLTSHHAVAGALVKNGTFVGPGSP